MKSTIHLTGSPNAQTKQLVVNLLAPSKEEIIATTASASHSRASSSAGRAALGKGGGTGGGTGGDGMGDVWGAPSYLGATKEEYVACRDEPVCIRGRVALGGESALAMPAATATKRGASEKVFGGCVRRDVHLLLVGVRGFPSLYVWRLLAPKFEANSKQFAHAAPSLTARYASPAVDYCTDARPPFLSISIHPFGRTTTPRLRENSRALLPTTNTALLREASARPVVSEGNDRGYRTVTPSPSTSGAPTSRSSSKKPSEARRQRGRRLRLVTSRLARRERCARCGRRRKSGRGATRPR